MNCWATTLTTNGETLGKVPIKRNIFQGNSLPPLLFIICLAALSKILEGTHKGYQSSFDKPLIVHG